MFYWTPVSHRHPLSAIPVSAPVASSSFLNFNQPGVHCCLLEGGWASPGDTSSDWLRASIKYSAWPMHSPPVARWCILRRHKALTAACGANPALHSSHVAVSPFIIRLMRRTQAVQSISASPFSFYRPPPFHLLLWSAAPCFSFINTAFDVGLILLCRSSNTATCVIVLDLSRCQGYLACSATVFSDLPYIRQA